MQYEEPVKQTKLTIREDKAVSVALTDRGAKLNCVGFNILFIMERKPEIAVEIVRLMQEAGELTPDTVRAPEQDAHKALAQLQALLAKYKTD